MGILSGRCKHMAQIAGRFDARTLTVSVGVTIFVIGLSAACGIHHALSTFSFPH